MSHTKGKVRVIDPGSDKGEYWIVNDDGGDTVIATTCNMDIAERLAALWNAAAELELATEKIAKGDIQATFTRNQERSKLIWVALERIVKLEAEKAAMLDVLEWYAEHVGNCNKSILEGAEARHALAMDHGQKAQSAIRKARGEE